MIYLRTYSFLGVKTAHMHRTLEETEIGAVNEFQISRFVNFVNGLEVIITNIK